MNAPTEGESPVQVWLTVIDPETPDGRGAIQQWEREALSEWAIPAKAAKNDIALAWVTGGVGFRYLLKVQESPRKSAENEYGPQQASMSILYGIEPPLKMSDLKGDPVVRRWWPVRSSMQGLIRAQSQSQSVNHDAEWSAFVKLLERHAPNAAAELRRTVPIAPIASTPGGGPNRGISVSLKDDGSTTPVTLALTRQLADVLVRASGIDQKRDSFDLSFSSLMLAILYGSDSMGTWLRDYFAKENVQAKHLLSKVGKSEEAAKAAAAAAMAKRDSILTSPLDRTISARQALDEAKKIAEAQPVALVDTPHLVAAFISLTEYHEEDFGGLALDRQRWGAAFVQRMGRNAKNNDELLFWRRFYTRRFPGIELPPIENIERLNRRPDYDADAYTSTDLLSIEDEVVALSYVIAAKQTRPPMAIGLFGEWGSGKTFFMKHLRKQIEDLCNTARPHAPRERECHANIAQIEFNAWHYQEGDLWASLVDHILRNLRFGEDEDEALVSERRDKIVRELDSTEAREKTAAARAVDVDQQVLIATERVRTLKQQENARREELARELTPGMMLKAAREGINLNPEIRRQGEALAKEMGVPVLQNNALALQQALSAARQEATGVLAFLMPLKSASDSRKRILLLGVALAAPILLGFVVSTLSPLLVERDFIGKVSSVLATVGGLLATVTTWVAAQTKWTRRLREQVEPVVQAINREIDNGVEAALGEQKKAVLNKMNELDALRQAQAQALKEKEEASSQAAALKTSLAVLGDDGLMRAFLDDRLSGGVYQQKLGIAALVRRDFERLSRGILKVTEREDKGELRDNELVINRIVLYIDDLDRCEMDKVVPVLRAVHLLLAFPAFIVVVGVDSRWVARCLEKHHQEIFASESGGANQTVTPLDYLEKIFQIPIWLEPVAPEQRVSMVRELLRRPVVRITPPTIQAEAKPETPGSARPTKSDPAGAGQPLPDQKPEASPEPKPPQLEQTADTALDLNPPGLSISDGEYEFLAQLGDLLSPSPRSIKRFVNTYRLISVSLAQAGVGDSDFDPPDFQIRMFLLAVFVGMPDFSRCLQQAVRNASGDPEPPPLMVVMDDAIKEESAQWSTERAQAEWITIRDWIRQRADPWESVTPDRLEKWLNPVGRYTFNLTRSVRALEKTTEEVLVKQA